MLEMTAGQFFRLMIFALLLMTLLVSAYIGFSTLYLKQQMQSASDLLSSTGGYMRTEQQQRQWWSLTHNPIMQLTDVRYVGVTKEDQEMGVVTNKIDRGAPDRLHDRNAMTSFPTYQISDSGVGFRDGSISDSTFDAIEDKARRSSGGVALNGPTGVRVNEKMLKQEHAQKAGYMQVPAHYGTSIKFVVSSKIPIWFFNGGNGKDFSKMSTSFLSFDYQGQTASLRGNDSLYVNGKNAANDQKLADVQSRAVGLIKLASGQNGVDPNTFGYGYPGINLDSSTLTYYQGQAQPIASKWISQIQGDNSQQDIINNTRSALNELNGIFLQNGGTYTDPGSHKVTKFKTERAGLNPRLVFEATNGHVFSPNNLPNDYTLWPKAN